MYRILVRVCLGVHHYCSSSTDTVIESKISCRDDYFLEHLFKGQLSNENNRLDGPFKNRQGAQSIAEAHE